MDILLISIVPGSLGLLAVQLALLVRREKRGPVGAPPIPLPLFFLAKISLAVPILALLLKMFRHGSSPPALMVFLFLGLWLAGTLVLALSFRKLGNNLRVGLPREETSLVRTGPYRFSRNPIYVGLYFLLAGSLVYAFSWTNLAAVAVAVLLHHRIILAEEKFLAGRFRDFTSYRRATPRYVWR